MHSSGALERLFDYTTPAVLHRVQRVLVRLAVRAWWPSWRRARPSSLSPHWCDSLLLPPNRGFVSNRESERCRMSGLVHSAPRDRNLSLAQPPGPRGGLTPTDGRDHTRSRVPQRMSSSQLARGGSTYSLSLRSAAWLCHTSQVLTRDPRLTLKGCERLLCVLSTCNGDDFAVCTADTGSLRLVFDLLCRMDADPTLVRDATAARGKGGIALYHSAQVQVRGVLTLTLTLIISC